MKNDSEYGKVLSLDRIDGVLVALCVLLCVAVLVAWHVDYRPLLSIVPDSATMKVNTALIFILSGFNLFIFRSENPKVIWVSRILNVSVALIGILTLIEYGFGLDLAIDNWLVYDHYSDEFPGRMSAATAFCAILLAVGIEFGARGKKLNNIYQYFNLAVLILALVSIVSFILAVPFSNRIFLLKTMAIHTAALYLIFSFVAIHRGKPSGISKLLFGELTGSTMIRKLTPVLILLPIIFSFALLRLVENGQFSFDFGVAVYTIAFSIAGWVYTILIGKGMNLADAKRRHLEDNLRDSNDNLSRFKYALDLTAIVSKTNNKGEILYANESFEEISGYSMSELFGKNHSIVNSGYHPNEFYKDLWSTIMAGDVWVGQIKNKSKSGTEYWEQKAIVPVRGESGEIEEYIDVAIDISTYKNIEQESENRLIQKLQFQNKELEQFAYVATHDLQEPLRTLNSFSDLLATTYGEQLDEEGRHMLRFIKESSDRMRTLVKSLMDYSRIGRRDKRQVVDMNDVFDEVRKDLDLDFSDVDLELHSVMPTVFGWKTELRLLWQNLISNAIKYSKEGVRTKVDVFVENEDLSWVFKVQDNGIGIDPRHHSKIFVIFQRLHLKNEYEGTGIGLAHCKKIVELHGGKLWLESTLGEGCTFYFSLPKDSL